MAATGENEERPDDALTQGEIDGTAASSPDPSSTPQNAFSKLMSSKQNNPLPSSSKPKRKRDDRTAGPSSHRSLADPTTGKDLNAAHGRDALGAYIARPQAFPSPARVAYFTDRFVALHDLYPKSALHMLLLPRDPAVTLAHSFDALADPALLAAVRAEVATLRAMLAAELRRRHARVSAGERARNAALDAADPPDELPPGRDWAREVRAGVHAHPSMTHLHVHVLSVDRYSECMRHRKHYNSFSTPFFVPLEDFPLPRDDPRRHPGREGYLERNLVCWRCGMDFGNKFKKLKEHLAEEYESWRRV